MREHLLDASADRFSSTKVEDALLAEARALFASEDVPSDMIGAVLSESDSLPIAADGTFTSPPDSMRIGHGYIGPTRVTNVIMRKGLGKPTDHNSIPTIGDPAIFREGSKTYVLPPGAFSGKNIVLFYVKEVVDLESIPAAFTDVITLGAASFLAADALEEKTSAILSQRRTVHLARVLGTAQ